MTTKGRLGLILEVLVQTVSELGDGRQLNQRVIKAGRLAGIFGKSNSRIPRGIIIPN